MGLIRPQILILCLDEFYLRHRTRLFGCELHHPFVGPSFEGYKILSNFGDSKANSLRLRDLNDFDVTDE